MATATLPAEPAPSGAAAFLAALSLRAIFTATGLALLGAGLLNPIFVIPFTSVLARALVLALALLVAWAAARAWAPRWLPRPWAIALAIVLSAPLATAIVYAVVSGGVVAFVSEPQRLSGFVSIALVGIVLGLLAAAGAGVRERITVAETRALRLELERSRLEKQALDARLALLQAQIEPHFLFNTLANVQVLVESQSPRAAPVLQSLIDYLRAAMPRLHEAAPTLGHEIALVRAYLELMRMRMPDRLQFSIDVPSALAARPFPAMALLTLVENAVRHGIDPCEDGGRIEVGGREEGAGFALWVCDTGPGMDPHAAPGTGLSNLRDRLAAFFGAGATLSLDEVAPHGLRAAIRVPA